MNLLIKKNYKISSILSLATIIGFFISSTFGTPLLFDFFLVATVISCLFSVIYAIRERNILMICIFGFLLLASLFIVGVLLLFSFGNTH